jgi:hypothetical protein
MSHVSNVLLSFSLLEEEVKTDLDPRRHPPSYVLMTTIEAWLRAEGYGTFGADVDTVSGGAQTSGDGLVCGRL